MLVLMRGNTFPGSSPYPDNTESVISFTATLSNSNFSINDAVSRFGTFHPGDAEVVSSEYISRSIIPIPAHEANIEKIRLGSFDGKIESIEIDYKQSVQISYERLKKEYGEPDYAPGPVCAGCPHRVGFIFKYTPKVTNDNSNKYVNVFVWLKLKDQKIPKEPSTLSVKTMRFQRP
jgi:hypothetical protein